VVKKEVAPAGGDFVSKIILGIHGLGNKPRRKVLEAWWREAILEGLKAIGHPRPTLKLELVYWADFLHEEPLDLEERDKNHPLYIEDPYIPANRFRKKERKKLSEKLMDYLRKQLSKVYLNKDLSVNYTAISDLIIRHYFRDLDTYYCQSCLDKRGSARLAKDVMREQLTGVFEKHKRKDVLLISHSMGTIIAYDVLSLPNPHIRVDTWVTIGSPLGLPAVMIKILSEKGMDYKKEMKPPTPDSILRNWYNFTDVEDRVSLDQRLGEYYKENIRQVRPIDVFVTNDYEYEGNANPHKSYGYLRTPELAEVIRTFLDHGKPGVIVRLYDGASRILSWIYEKRRK
jgi:hypothetical protein